jgi:hypothetical protein
MSRKGRRPRQRNGQKNQSGKPVLVYLVLGVGLVLLLAGLGYGYLSGQQTAQAALDYQPGDVADQGPLLAVHEMGQGPAIPFLPRSQPQPDVEVPEKFYDFGSIGPTDVVERTFIVRNKGEAPLTISRAYTTCGCTTAEISASIIPPGKVATVKIRFDAGYHDTAGQTVRRGVILENNDPDQSQAEVWIQASVRSG